MSTGQSYTIASVATAAPFPTDLVAMISPQGVVRVRVREYGRFTSEARCTTSHRKLGEMKRSEFEGKILYRESLE